MSYEPDYPLLKKVLRFQERTLPEYLEYCQAVRTGLQTDSTKPDREFFKTKFVNEMEPLGVVANWIDFSGSIKVQHLDEELADGVISLSDGRLIYVECTSARDSRRIDLVQREFEKGNLVSFNGPAILTDEDAENVRLGRDLAHWGDMDDDFLYFPEILIRRVIEKKLAKSWSDRENWLCVVVTWRIIWQVFWRIIWQKMANYLAISCLQPVTVVLISPMD